MKRSKIWPGVGWGFVAFVAVTGVVYLTPVRVTVLALAGHKLPTWKREMQSEYLGLQQREQQIAAAPKVPDDLKTAQENAWRRYTALRGQLGAWVQSQSHASLSGFGVWVGDLWMWLAALGLGFPIAGALAGRALGSKTAATQAPRHFGIENRKAEEMAHLQTAARRGDEPAKPAEADTAAPWDEPSPGPTTRPVEPLFQEPETAPTEPPRVGKVDLEFLEDLSAAPPVPPPDPDAVWTVPALSMEDEGAHALSAPRTDAETTDDPPLGKMPETTEFEQLERQREEVLRYARKGMTPSEIARRLRMGQDQVDLIIRIRRERG